jgi:hypothetical protein
MKRTDVKADMADFMMRREMGSMSGSMTSRIGGFGSAKLKIAVDPSIGYTIVTIGDRDAAVTTLYLRPDEVIALIDALREAQ